MCCFSRAVRHVSGTRIFARALDHSRQALVYSMTLAADEALAMILPLPVPVGLADDGVRFVDLSAYDGFFDDVARAFPMPAAPQAFGRATGDIPRARPLVVHEVGSFEASFVPRLRDFDRLDPRFRMPDGVFDALPQVRDWGFAVFQLRDFGGGFFDKLANVFRPAKSASEKLHPMAFEFPRRDPTTIFFPTLHVHDGTVEAKAHFDHTLYLQHDDAVATEGWWSSGTALGAYVDLARTKDIVDGALQVRQRAMHGSHKNEDVFVRIAKEPTPTRRAA